MRTDLRARLLPGLTGRVFLVTAAIVCAVLAAALAAASVSARAAAVRDARRGLEQAADLTAQLLAGRGRSLAGGARVFVQGPYFRALVAERRRDDILDQAFEGAEQLEADWVFITDERGVLLAKSDEPGAAGEPMAGIPLVAGALEGRVTTGFGASRDSVLFQTVAVPIVVPGAAPVGTLVATRVVDTTLARDVQAATGTDVVFYTLEPDGRRRVAASTMPRDAAAALLPASNAARVDDDRYLTQHAALVTAGGDPVGGFMVVRAAAAIPTGLAGVRRSLLVAGALGLLLALAAAWLAALRVTRPTRTLAAAARAAIGGDYVTAARTARDAAARTSPDEITALAGALGTLLAELREKELLVAVLEAAAPLPVAGAPSDAPAAGGSAAVRTRGALVPRRATHPAPHRAPRIGGTLSPGDTFAGRYAVQAELGRGGAGIVYRALDLLVDERVALKLLRPELLATDAQARERLIRELRLARRVSHRNVVRTHDLMEHDGTPFITMEFVEGASLGTVLRARGPLAAHTALALARQLARALEAAHEQGVVHGDLKPENLLVRLDGLLKVGDFGVATLMRRGGPAAPRLQLAGTIGGAIVGTPEYMAPEVLLGSEPDVRADLYAMGMVLHACLSGGTPYQVDTPRAFLARKLDAPAPRTPDAPTALTAVPGDLHALVADLTAPDPDARPATAAAVAARLARIA
ncbi:protein kinase domain-containing protein [Roseisolibacter agri]|uniref:Non-specific serine/threonine protein kinase n=1 Tax=Roseisolibacter agri TaxID=2014610 RepID=A0AA37V7K9_9BACT|nr:protein kinase [Roseisolibacter agri]GLC26771.1 hypothetical protein rosag_32840 [Roseisolibacter agri]